MINIMSQNIFRLTLAIAGIFGFLTAVADTPPQQPPQTPPLPVPTDSKLIQSHTNATAYFTDDTINHVLWPIVTQHTAFPDIPKWYANAERSPFPPPTNQNYLNKRISLRDAIWIALRNNPTVKNAEVQRIEDKFALEVAQHNFVPQYTDNFTYSRNMETGVDTLTTTGGISLNTPFSTTISADFQNDTKSYFDHRNTYTANITQPLLNGGWLTPWYNYLDAVEAEQVGKLNFQLAIIGVVVQVITNYNAVVSDINQLELNKKQYQQTVEELRQDELKVKLGRMSRSSLTQAQVALETNNLSVVVSANQLQTDYEALLVSLGLVTKTPLKINRLIDIRGFDEPDLKTCIKVALAHNQTYLEDKLQIGNDKRALIIAINQLLPTFTPAADFTYGNGQKTVPTLSFTASIPIDDITAYQTEITARITLEQDKIALAQQRQTIISEVISDWQTVQDDLEQISIAKKQVALQNQVVKDDRLSLSYGKMTMFQYQEDRSTLLSDQVNLVTTKISYIQDVSSLDQLMGIILQRWNIKLRY